ncbi:Elongator subunit elp2 [Emydomyces testavorans]|uniref:Elongator complex protein 2 n=1 Tax=Emydomyces testavorans TaxID=2070801 RepID=A0AAF0ILM5_9EURO|nr:Elongator subunit elp2 [Emydomyces testavorans]
MVSITTEYISVGGNRHPAAADWHQHSGLVAFGADNNVALWDPADRYNCGVYALLVGHTDKVNAVKFYTPTNGDSRRPLLISGSADRAIRVWMPSGSSPLTFTLAATLQAHENSINCLAVAERADIVVSGAADGTIKTWKITENEGGEIKISLLEAIPINPRFFPLTLALRELSSGSSGEGLVLAVGGTRNIVQIYVAPNTSTEARFELKATLTGHEGWIRSLAFTKVELPGSQDFLLASASQDKYIRLWRVHGGDTVSTASPRVEDAVLGAMQPTLSNKAHTFEANGINHSITFEALLFGHEDWVYSIAWNPNPHKLQLMSSSADNSLVIWESDPVSGVWYSGSRMGEISVQKGSTTATGSAGGFWIGLWSPDGNVVISLGRTGSWRSWRYDSDADAWAQIIGITGHVRSVNDIVWEPSGGYLLSTSGDQTTRLHASWRHNGYQSWHEFSRPQIHGYDLNCIASLGSTRFVSAADEKLLRVFDETKSVAQLLEQLSGLEQTSQEELAEAANIPVLGLSNKAVDEADIDGEDDNEANGMEGDLTTQAVSLDLDHPPLEDHLARHTLWPEHEKLYGHGYEISAVAASNDRSLIATACKASSIDHAVIRLYDTETWREIRPPLAAHSLTITSLRFSSDDRYFLSVGRDRQWAVFERDSIDKALYRLFASNLKAHSRMILSASWAPLLTIRNFATAGRDKSVKIWAQEGANFTCKSTITVTRPVTAIDFLPVPMGGKIHLAVGDDSGEISVHEIAADGLAPEKSVTIRKLESPSKAITQLSWRPISTAGRKDEASRYQLAVASEDSSVRIYNIDNLST